MNEPIVRLFGFVVVMFALLLAFTSRWTIFQAASLRDDPLNARGLLEQQRIDRGTIFAADGSVLARSVRSSASTRSESVYERTYPSGELFGHPVGYYNIDLGRTGIERYRNAALNGQSDAGVQTILDQLQGKKKQGNDLYTTLDPSAQQVAKSALGEHQGAVVALDPRTGAVRVMTSTPGYDPNALRSQSSYRKLLASSGGKGLVNRATQFGYAPGSTFKVVTATAAIDTGQFTPESTVNGRNDVPISGVPLQNDDNESLGDITLTEALAKSVNTVWAQVAEKLGASTMARYMNRFGFDRKPQLDYPAEEMSASGEYQGARLISPRSPLVDVGRMGIGQDKLEVVPLQMAEVAAAVANRGRLMTPHLTDRIVDPDGRTVRRISPRVQAVVMKRSTAAAVTGMMEAVVNEGTGTPAQIPGVQVAGKTGTAETQIGTEINNVWFIAFAPAAHPTVAIAVTLKGVPGQGASFAAPVAREVMESLLHG